MDIRHLRYFLAIAELGSITRAAAQLNVAQPALSLHVKNMEAELGTQLLLRSKSGVTPTEAGHLLMQRARAILDDLARTQDDIRTLESDPMGVVCIGLPSTISTILALPLIEAARKAYPRIRLNVAEAMSGFIADWLAEGRVDLAVLYESSGAANIASDHLLQEELVVLWPPGTACLAEMSLAGLRDVPLVLPSRPHGLRGLIDGALEPLGIVPRIAQEIDSYTNIKRLVTAGYGASILPRHAVLAEARDGAVEISRIAAPGFWRSAYLVYPSGRPVTRAREAVLALTEEVIDSLLQTGAWAGARPVARR
ncbi:LysR family transcriptional regulator [Pseudooceanicola sp.]|uniref:LysR family transcriptional regulator n=1 Tax=Pseudooceanicola sp. TaxID=1914328 RepID=UPI0035115A71